MKIGVITFHWATNYGAVIQTYALQECLKSLGHIVEIINYKPSRYDWMPYKSIIRNPRSIISQLRLFQRESAIKPFRNKYLNQTKRYRSSSEIEELSDNYDAVISGSDQILNPSFTIGGEGRPTNVYYLCFVRGKSKKIGYAVSFGCTDYPAPASKYAKAWMPNFDVVGVRENSGLDILKSLKYKGEANVVPDPTLLLGTGLFDNLDLKESVRTNQVCIYMLGCTDVIFPSDINATYIDERHRGISLESWLENIRDASSLVTNSYHGMMMALLFHTPFAVIKKQQSTGQNDRLITILEKIGLTDRMVDNDFNQISNCLKQGIDWIEVDNKLESFRQIGISFLKQNLTK